MAINTYVLLLFYSEREMVQTKVVEKIKTRILCLIGGGFPGGITIFSLFDVFLTVHHSIELFHLPTLMHNSLYINNMYVTLLSSTCFEH